MPNNKKHVLLNKTQVSSVFKILHKTWPNAECELIHFNAFQLLIAVVLSAQTTDKSVNKVLGPIYTENKNFSPEDLIKMGLETFYQKIKTIGLAPTKSKNAYKIAEILIKNFDSKVPRDRASLEALPGVGRKTTNVVLNVLEKLPTIAVDTHVARLSQRMGLVKQNKNRLKIEEDLIKILPKEYECNAHHLLIFHGRYHCIARKPKCETCPLDKICPKNDYV